MNVLKPLVNELIKLIKKGANLANSELPVVASQILRFYLWASIMWVLLGLASILLGVFFTLKLQLPGLSDLNTFLLWLGAGASYLFGVLAFVSNLLDIFKITLAPRLFLLEYLKSFLSSDTESN